MQASRQPTIAAKFTFSKSIAAGMVQNGESRVNTARKCQDGLRCTALFTFVLKTAACATTRIVVKGKR
ncbi:hypothetical protein D1Y84_16995 [Acidipila sp. EB88]|nr:hypothetical protein D1Y84_16995 [Acidipila sp. EB88]